MPEPASRPQPARANRFWLWAPYVVLLLALLAWTGVWLAMKARLEAAFEAEAARLRAHGYTASWSALRVSGWPFRLHLTLVQPRIGEPSGWALAAPIVLGQAEAYAPDRWIFAATEGLVATRPGRGPLSVQGRAIRASVGGLGTPRPRLSFEGLDLTLSPLPGGRPAPFASASRLELHLQPGPDDQAALFVRIDGAALAPASPLARLGPKGGFDLRWDGRLSHVSALRGPSWPAALQAWAAAGGAMTVADARIQLGGVALQGSGGPLTVGPDGRLQGVLPLTLASGRPPGWAALLGPLDLRFAHGRAALGPIDVGPALKVG